MHFDAHWYWLLIHIWAVRGTCPQGPPPCARLLRNIATAPGGSQAGGQGGPVTHRSLAWGWSRGGGGLSTPSSQSLCLYLLWGEGRDWLVIPTDSGRKLCNKSQKTRCIPTSGNTMRGLSCPLPRPPSSPWQPDSLLTSLCLGGWGAKTSKCRNRTFLRTQGAGGRGPGGPSPQDRGGNLQIPHAREALGKLSVARAQLGVGQAQIPGGQDPPSCIGMPHPAIRLWLL